MLGTVVESKGINKNRTENNPLQGSLWHKGKQNLGNYEDTV
jgi:hypothetical protein